MPSNIIVHGLDSAVKQAARKSFKRGAGVVTRENYRGSAAAVEAKFKELSLSDNGGDLLEVESNGSTANLSVELLQSTADGSSNGDAAISETWELMPLEIQKPIEAYFSFADQAEIKAARKAFDTQKEYTGGNADALNYLKFREQMIESYTISAYVIRKTSVVGSKKAISAPWDTIDTAIGFHEIDNDGVPELLRNAIPADWEWLVKAPTYRQVDRGRFQMVQEWYGAQKWSKLLYDGTADP